MKIKNLLFSLLAVFSFLSTESHAKISQPDYILYGTATWFGAPLANESEITIYLDSQLVTVAKYSMGTNANLNGLYALNVPMDSNDPREFGKARPGDPASIFINGNLVAEVLVGDYGVAERLDIDPINLSGSASVINALPASVTELDSDETTLNMTISISNESQSDVSVDWETVSGTAIGSDACTFDVDYLNSNGTATIVAGQLETEISVTVCGDTLIELSETFEVVLSNAQNGIIQFDRAVATILDNDGQPELRGNDAVIFEPGNGVLSHAFEFRLSRPYEQDVSVDYVTVAGTATEGLDYVFATGQLLIPAGTQDGSIVVDYLSDDINEEIEVMTIALSNAVNANLVNTELTAFILDATNDQQTEESDSITSADVPTLISPSDVHFSQDGKHVYVSSLSGGGSIIRFGFENGVLTYDSTVDSGTVGFESGLFGLIRDITLTNDGRFMYAAASGDQAIMSIQRDLGTGQLSLTQTLENNSPNNLAIDGVYGLDISPDSSHLYAVGSQSDGIAVFSINSTDGSLAFIESEIQGIDDPGDAGPPVSFMDRPIDVMVAPDGTQVFVASDFSSSLSVFDRDVSTGELSFRESFKNGVSGVDGLGGASAVWVSGDNQAVYVLGRADDAIVRFSRDGSGQLSYEENYQQSNADFIGLDAPTALLGNADDDRLYTLGFDDSTMVTFKRDRVDTSAEFAELTFADIEQDDVDDVNDMSGPIALDLSPDGKWLLVAAGIDNAIEVFKTHLNDLIFEDGFE